MENNYRTVKRAIRKQTGRLMAPRWIKWALFIVPALIIGTFETIRHTLLGHILPMELGNWVTALIDAAVIALIARKLFQQYASTEMELYQARESHAIYEERERLARILHDQIAQTIFYSGVQVDSAMKLAKAHNDKTLTSTLQDVHLSLREIDENIRQAIFNLKYETMESVHFEDRVLSYIHNAFSESQITTNVQFPKTTSSLSPSEQVQLFGILQEATTNIRKHANASFVIIKLDIQEDNPSSWIFSIQDNGCGFDPNSVSEIRYGLDIIASRAGDIDAKLQIESDSTGTTIQIRH
jgi:signal transduction histidine kinase